MYEEIVAFVRNECAKQPQVDDLQGEVPPSVIEALKERLTKKPTIAQLDTICRRVYEKESEWRRDQVKTIIELVGDVPKHSIGADIQDTDSGISIDKLIEDVMGLPNMGMADSDLDENGKSFKVLTEYTNLRADLRDKCQAIKLGTHTALELDKQARMIESLLHSTIENNPDYFSSYRGKVATNLQELTRLLEEAIKMSDSHPEKKAKLRKIMDNL